MMSSILNIMPIACECLQKSHTANRSKSHSDCWQDNSNWSSAKIACVVQIANEVEMGYKRLAFGKLSRSIVSSL